MVVPQLSQVVPQQEPSISSKETLGSSPNLMVTMCALCFSTRLLPFLTVVQIKNLSPTEPLVFLEIFKADRFVDFSATQW